MRKPCPTGDAVGVFSFCSVCLICRFATLSRVIGFVVRSRIGTGIAPAALRGGTRRSDSHPRHYRSRCAVSVILHICANMAHLPFNVSLLFFCHTPPHTLCQSGTAACCHLQNDVYTTVIPFAHFASFWHWRTICHLNALVLRSF